MAMSVLQYRVKTVAFVLIRLMDSRANADEDSPVKSVKRVCKQSHISVKDNYLLAAFNIRRG